MKKILVLLLLVIPITGFSANKCKDIKVSDSEFWKAGDKYNGNRKYFLKYYNKENTYFYECNKDCKGDIIFGGLGEYTRDLKLYRSDNFELSYCDGDKFKHYQMKEFCIYPTSDLDSEFKKLKEARDNIDVFCKQFRDFEKGIFIGDYFNKDKEYFYRRGRVFADEFSKVYKEYKNLEKVYEKEFYNSIYRKSNFIKYYLDKLSLSNMFNIFFILVSFGLLMRNMKLSKKLKTLKKK